VIRAPAAAAVAAVAASVAAAAHTENGVETRTCASRSEGAQPIAQLALPGDVTLGPVSFRGLARFRGRPELLGRVGDRRTAKAGVVVTAGLPTVVETRDGTLSYAMRDDGRAVAAVALHPCPPSTHGWSGGTVGRYTAFAGGFVVARPGCVLVIVTRGRRHWVRNVPLGVDRCA
jgi:hypothetical protein